MKKRLLIIAGFGAAGVGMLGVFVPLLPTTPFALLALYCFSLSSPRFKAWLLNNGLLGPLLRNISEGRGLSVREKVRILLVVWVSILGAVIWLLDEHFPAQVALVVIAAIKTVVTLRYKTRREGMEVTS